MPKVLTGQRRLYLLISAVGRRFLAGNRRAAARGVDAAGRVRCDARQFSTGKGKRCARSLPMGFERTAMAANGGSR